MVKDVGKDVDVFENDIDKYLQLFCEEQDIEDLRVVPLTVWNAALMYVCKHVFKNTKILKTTETPDSYKKNNNTCVRFKESTCNAYDLKKVCDVADIYIYYCMLYDKNPNKQGFINLTGITWDTMCKWQKDNKILSQEGAEFLQNIEHAEEMALESKLYSLRNPTGALASLNHKHGWREDGKVHVPHIESKTAAELPRLDTPQDIVAIENKSH